MADEIHRESRRAELAPDIVVQSGEPSSPPQGLDWFDTTNTVRKLYADGTWYAAPTLISAGLTDHSVLRANGTTGIQDSGSDIKVDDSHYMTFGTGIELRFVSGTNYIKATGASAVTFNSTLTTLSGTGLYLNQTTFVRVATTTQLQFRDTGLYIYSSADGVLDVVSDGTVNIGAYGHCDFGESGGTVYDLRPAADLESDLGSSARRWNEAWVNELHVQVSTDNVSDPPTDSQLDTAFGAPGTVGDGFIGILDDNNGQVSGDVWLCVTRNASWFYVSLTKAV